MNVLAVFILLVLSMINVVGFETLKSDVNAKDSPLFRIRTQKAINEKISEMECSFIGDRLFLFPINFLVIDNFPLVREQIERKSQAETHCRGCLTQQTRCYPSLSCTMCVTCNCPFGVDDGEDIYLRERLNKKPLTIWLGCLTCDSTPTLKGCCSTHNSK